MLIANIACVEIPKRCQDRGLGESQARDGEKGGIGNGEKPPFFGPSHIVLINIYGIEACELCGLFSVIATLQLNYPHLQWSRQKKILSVNSQYAVKPTSFGFNTTQYQVSCLT